ncbi:SDR family oxidoreductase [Nocardioides sp. JQ2195]|uniref:SDR family NAD(P)-dependent oxidoreductase n=1 Tax=Nocardioides sp. JQ2195 TaxID=2592334 RepID=UPI00143E2A74|nr:SDR family oxidoreductase [Nocardioides sp. JQ2195]QIX28090.1 SDR family oxidoreductase [Nocardioides sp. JQ2195]
MTTKPHIQQPSDQHPSDRHPSDRPTTPVALVTGGSTGLGRSLVHVLAATGWRVITTARNAAELEEAHSGRVGITVRPGDLRSADHRSALAQTVREHGRLDLLVHNASDLGPTPLPPLADVRPEQLHDVLEVNLVAPIALTSLLLPLLSRDNGVLLSLSSDAAVEHYPGWGAYGASKAALDHATLTLAAENQLRGYAVDPGDMRTRMHQAAFPGEDISDRPSPESVVPHLLALIPSGLASGRYRAADIDASLLVEGAAR